MKNLLVFMAISFMAVWGQAAELKSPNGSFHLNFEVKDGVPVYSLQLEGQPVILESRLGLELKALEPLTEGFKLFLKLWRDNEDDLQ